MHPLFFVFMEGVDGNCGSALADRPLDYPITLPRHRLRYRYINI